jgi:hypothetical protein
MGRALLERRARGGMTLLALDPIAYGRVRRDGAFSPVLPGIFLECGEAAVDDDIRPRHIGRGVG